MKRQWWLSLIALIVGVLLGMAWQRRIAAATPPLAPAASSIEMSTALAPGFAAGEPNCPPAKPATE
ncbi:MAG: hypothetical protein HYV17_09725 [Xanthomonadales bacterium]|nr:hypothetical protein [Xanthomonadales bacterium]